MPASIPLPDSLTHSAFSTRNASAAGVGPGRLRGSDILHPHHGSHLSRDRLDEPNPALPYLPLSTGTVAALVAAQNFAPVLRTGQHFSHLTAAQLWGCPLPKSLERAPLHVTGPRAPRYANVIGHSSPALARGRRFGLPVVDPVTLFCQLAALVGRGLTLDDLVAIGDHLVVVPHVAHPYDPRPHITLPLLEAGIAEFRGRGSRIATSAVPLVREGAESRPETLMRLLLDRAGLPMAEINPEVTDAFGKRIGYPDLLYRAWKVIVEYDGDQHRIDSAQYDKDMWRLEKFIEAGYAVVRVRKRALFAQPTEVVARVRRALASHGWQG